ncbi:MAG: 50S ribosomal protein L23 [bacterium]|nr:50S ribosomal protein L23 [bacterium]
MEFSANQIIIEPLLTERAHYLRQQNKYIFKVNPKANKIQIRKAVENAFSVKVIAVNTLRQQGKKKVVRRIEGRKPEVKKAIVTLAKDQTIGIFEGV